MTGFIVLDKINEMVNAGKSNCEIRLACEKLFNKIESDRKLFRRILRCIKNHFEY